MQSVHAMLSDSRPCIVDRVDTPVDRSEVLRYLGYPAGVLPHPRVASRIEQWIDRASQLSAPRAIYRVLPVVDQSRRRLRLDAVQGSTRFDGAIGEFLGPVRFVAVFIATAGVGPETLASRLMREGKELDAMVASAVGAERAEAAEAAVIEQLGERVRPRGLATTLPYSPGYCGMNLTEQTKLFSLLDGQQIGVTLTKDCLMRPIKSVSGLIGIGQADLVEVHGSPCDRCELYTCSMRR